MGHKRVHLSSATREKISRSAIQRALARQVAMRNGKLQVAALSAHNNDAIGARVAAVMNKVSDETAIMVEGLKTTETDLDVAEGIPFDRGLVSPCFVTNADKMSATERL